MPPKRKAITVEPGQDAELVALKAENAELKAEVSELRDAKRKRDAEDDAPVKWYTPGCSPDDHQDTLNTLELERYVRHLSLPAFGIEGQAKLKNARVLIVGVGGLGSPAALYLAAAGVGFITLCDADTVEVTNLHRQIIHANDRVDVSKAHSGAMSCKALNPHVNVEVALEGLTKDNALGLVDRHNIVLDCTDNVPTRYMLSDACVLTNKPLVSAAAVSLEGQLTVYNLHEDTPCYRCVWPKPPAAGDCTSCARGGVLGPVPGVMGVLQALEAVKVIAGLGETYDGKMLMFDACAAARPFTVMKLRKRDTEKCLVCVKSRPAVCPSTYDYEAFTAGTCTVKPKSKFQEYIDDEHKQICKAASGSLGFAKQGSQTGTEWMRIASCVKPSTHDFGIPLDTKAKPAIPGNTSQRHRMYVEGLRHWMPLNKNTVIDVRPRHLSQTAMLQGALQIPLAEMEGRFKEIERHMKDKRTSKIICVCSRGNDSQLAAAWLRSKGLYAADVIGGMEDWRRTIDPTFPKLV
jgi:adenylyltransferase/sulfurtransferase